MASGYEIILDFFRSDYQPIFRRKTAIYSKRLGREVAMTEACMGPGMLLLDQLAGAVDAPRDGDGKIKHNTLPRFFNIWCRSAWVDLLRSLPEEESGPEISDPAQEEFRDRIARALHTLFSFGPRVRVGLGESDEEKRSLVSWCALWAKPGYWVQARSLLIWMRRDHAGCPQLAVRVELFAQVHIPDLSKLSMRKFAALCERYGVGTGGSDCRPGGRRAVELHPDFIRELLPGVEGSVRDHVEAHRQPDREEQDTDLTGETHASAHVRPDIAAPSN